eukprot:g10083.t2
MSPAVLCEEPLEDGTQRVARNDKINKTRSEGTTPPPSRYSKSIEHQCKAETKPTAECPLAKHEPVTAASASKNQLEVIPETQCDSQRMSSGSGVVAPSDRKYCQHPGCGKTPRYGHEGAPAILCQSHKRAGMYTTRDGRVLVSTRDGKGVTEAPSAARSRTAAMRVQNVEPVSSDPDPAWTPSSSTISRLQSSTRPRFCSEHKGQGHVGLKNRPCLFPGCVTRPHYGLTKGRAVYCATHKKDGMVHLLKESIVLERERAARNREESRRKVAKRKKRPTAASAGKACDDEDEDDDEWTEERDFGRRSGRESSKRESRSKARGSCRRGRRNKAGLSRRDSTPSSVSSSGPPGWSRSQDTKDKAPDDSESSGHCGSAFPRYSQLPEGKGVSSVMAPSVEIKLLQQARESAKAAAEASGAGRRARAPSRKLLEASGALENEGAQWMTREIKEADAKNKKELREQRKQFKAAGLKAGEVTETFTVTPAGGGESAADADAEEGLAVSTNISAKEEVAEAVSLANVDKLPLKRAWVVLVPDTSAREGKPAMATGDATVPASKRNKQGNDGRNREDGRGAVSEENGTISARKQKTAAGGGLTQGSEDADEGLGDSSIGHAKCDFGNCSKTATFGVNATVRYW